MTGCFYVACDLINNKDEMDLQPFLSYCTYSELFRFLDYSVQQLHDSYTASSFWIKKWLWVFKRGDRLSEILCGSTSQVPLCFAADCHGDYARAVLGLGLYGVPSFPSERFVRFHYLTAESTPASDTYLARLFLTFSRCFHPLFVFYAPFDNPWGGTDSHFEGVWPLLKGLWGQSFNLPCRKYRTRISQKKRAREQFAEKWIKQDSSLCFTLVFCVTEHVDIQSDKIYVLFCLLFSTSFFFSLWHERYINHNNMIMSLAL